MSRLLARLAWGAMAALALGCEAAPEAFSSPYQRARLSFEPLATAPLAPVHAGEQPSGGAGETSPGGPTPEGRGGGGASAPAAPADRRGRVLGFLDGQLEPSPVEGAVVRTSDGWTITTDAEGRFNRPEVWPEDGTWTVRHPGFRASTIVGLPPSAELTLHLKTRAGFTRPDPSPPDRRFVVGGQVRDGNGQGLGGVLLLLGAPDGSFASPTMTDDEGRFQMHVVAREERVAGATIVALDRDQDAWMGAATGLAIASGETAIDFDPATPGSDPLVMLPTTHRLDVEVDDAGTGLPARVFVDLAYPGVEDRLLLFGHEQSVRLAAMPGARFGVEIDAADSARSRQSQFVQPDLALDFNRSNTTFTARLLPPPAIEPVIRTASLPEVKWAPVAGARGYEVRLDSTSKRGLEWEGFTTGTSIGFGVPVEALSGRYALQVVAWDAPGMTPRQVASTSRQLRLIPPSGAYRRAASEVTLAF